MLIKPRTESIEFKVLTSLNTRLDLHTKEKQTYVQHKKGYEGEQQFDKRLTSLTNNYLILHDLLLESNSSSFQIDSMLISNQIIYLFEIKNYEGDFLFRDGNWYTAFEKEIKNPILQLKRTESLFRALLQDLAIKIPIKAYIIFINPEFTLFHAPLDLPIVLPTQLNRFLKKLAMNSIQFNKATLKLAKQLRTMHINESPYSILPAYNFEQLTKGIICLACGSFMFSRTEMVVSCRCGFIENSETAVIRNVDELKLLFSNKKITTALVFDWCKIIKSKRTIQKILKEHYKAVGARKSTYYIDK